MKQFIYTLCGCLLSMTLWAQPGSDPAVVNRDLQPAPLADIGSTFSMTFTIGNNGAVALAGDAATTRMGFSVCLNQCELNAANPLDAVSGELRNYFDLSVNASTNCIDGVQKAMAIPAGAVYDLVISARVTPASTSTATSAIGASCTITPASSSDGQPTGNDVASIFTRRNATPMPVSLISFTTQVQEEGTVLLTWKTAWERANRGYFIERSKDMKRFDVVGEVTDVGGMTNAVNSYHFVDKNPYHGTSYYRLRQVDMDGTSHTFDAQAIVVNGRYGVYPNPLTGPQFTLELDEPTTAVLRLYTISGVELGVRKLDQVGAGLNLAPASRLSAGIYILTVEERGASERIGSLSNSVIGPVLL